jgi:type IV pilus assembly protein PilM
VSRLVGVSIDAGAVRGVEVVVHKQRAVVRAVGEVALPPETVGGGEVLDEAALASALKELWKQARFRTRHAVIGVAHPLAVARRLDLPKLAMVDLRGALRYELEDALTFPAEEAVFDLHDIDPPDAVDPETGEPKRNRTRLAVAAHQPVIDPLLAVAAKARLKVESIDLVPLAVVRAIRAVETADRADRSEAIVDLSGDLVSVVVHYGGRVAFCRLLIDRTWGTQTIGELEAELSRIEQFRQRALARDGGGGSPVESMPFETMPRDPLADAIRTSIEYGIDATVFSGQPAKSLDGLVLTGDPDRCDRIAPVLQAAWPDIRGGQPVAQVMADDAAPPDRASRYTAAFGLAVAHRIDIASPARLTLLPTAVLRRRAKTQVGQLSVSVGTGLAALLGGVTLLAGPNDPAVVAAVDAATVQADQVVAQLGDFTAELAQLEEIAAAETALVPLVPSRARYDEALARIDDALPEGLTLVALLRSADLPADATTTTVQLSLRGRPELVEQFVAAVTGTAPIAAAAVETLGADAPAIDEAESFGSAPLPEGVSVDDPAVAEPAVADPAASAPAASAPVSIVNIVITNESIIAPSTDPSTAANGEGAP